MDDLRGSGDKPRSSDEQERAIARREEGRPDPEDVLRRYGLQDDAQDSASVSPVSFDSTGASPVTGGHAVPKKADAHPKRGRLRIYLAAAAGAGKTYAMLNEGHRRKDRGRDVVIGYVETHRRRLTEEQIRDLEVIPRKKILYRDVILEEMDTEAIIARHPRVVLVDELAHTNVPGSKHRKRYQDVDDLLSAGIDVVTTLNIQHLESLNDFVATITGVRVRETLPDRILDQADEVELIDISPAALRQRMRHGNIYPPERIEPALSHFFREGNLTALRELALRRTAEKAESQLQHYMTEHGIHRTWPACERVLVGFDSRPHTRQVLRDAWRLAHGLHADLIAVFIRPEGYMAFRSRLVRLLKHGKNIKQYEEQALRRLEEHAVLAEDLGAEVIRTSSRDIAAKLVEIAKERQVTQIVLGQPIRSRWEELLRGSVVNRLLRMDAEADIHLVTGKSEQDE